MSEESFVYTACPGWGDHDYCTLKTIVKDGKIVRTEKMDLDGPEACDGHICQKGLLAARQPYNPNRLTHPLKRKEGTERGAGQWEHISWDQALDEIAEKLLAIKEKYGPEAISIWNFPAGNPPSSGMNPLLASRFAALWHTTDMTVSVGLDNGPFYAAMYAFGGDGMAQNMTDPKNYIGADVIWTFGCNPIENQMRGAMYLVKAREAGARIVDFGLIFDGTAGFADEFVGVAPGSDGFLAMAMANYIIQNELYDEDFLIQHTIATYLVDVASGKLMKDADGNYLNWCLKHKKAVAIAPAGKDAPQGGEIKAQEPALYGTYSVNGKTCKPAFQMLANQMAQYTLDAAEEVTNVPAEIIAMLTEEYASVDNAFIISAYGLRYTNQGETYRALELLGILTGNFGRPGAGVQVGGMLTSWPVAFNDAAVCMPEGPDGCKPNSIRAHKWFEAAASDNSPYKAFICPTGNPVHQQPYRGRWLKIFSQMELVVDVDIWLTDTGELADYVLPDCMPFEREEIINPQMYSHVILQEPAIDPPEEVHDGTYLWTELAKRVGLGEYFDKTCEEWLAMRLETDFPPIAQLDPPLTWERLKAEKCIRVANPETPFDPFAGLMFATATGRIEFYADRLVEVGRALPVYLPCAESPVIGDTTTSDEYPYQLFTGRQRFFMQSMFTDDPINIALSGGKPSTRINPEDAKDKGLKQGDKVEVYNQRGHVVTNLELDESVPPGTIHVWFGWRRRQFEEGTYSEMVFPYADPDMVDEVADKWWNDFYEMTGQGWAMENAVVAEIGSWDAYWDSACNIRKYEAK
jgi:molybdopterin-containing oxidoreductase family molybdopterin binding subunit